MEEVRYLQYPDRGFDMAEKITKQEAVRRALAHFGSDAKPAQMQGWIKSEFDIDMGTDHISTAKGTILRKGEVKGKRRGGRKPGRPKAAAQATAPQAAPKPAAGKESGIPLNDILYVKGLVGRFGSGPLHTLIDAFAR
jgi:hypothetical protein